MKRPVFPQQSRVYIPTVRIDTSRNVCFLVRSNTSFENKIRYLRLCVIRVCCTPQQEPQKSTTTRVN
jgi:hypothetical protein